MKHRAQSSRRVRKAGRPPGSKNKQHGAPSAIAGSDDGDDLVNSAMPKLTMTLLIQGQNGKHSSTLMIDSTNVTASENSDAIPSASSIQGEVVKAMRAESFWPPNPDEAEAVEKSLVLFTG